MERFRTIEQKGNIVEIDTNKRTIEIEYSCERHALAAIVRWIDLVGDLDDLIQQMENFKDSENWEDFL